MLLKQYLIAFAAGCSKKEMEAYQLAQQIIPEESNTMGRMSNEYQGMSNKWEEQRQLKSEMMEDITNCLTTRRRNMKKQDQNDLVKTDWYSAWDSHCSHQIDPACPIKAGECWAMGVITCRKNCDAKFLLRGNRGKFKRCIYKQMKIYEKGNPGKVADNCSILENTLE
jgi:hypothetical protein